MNNNRVLVYAVCDRRYAYFIPLFILSNLMFEKDADIEVGINFEGLTDSENKIIEKLKQEFPNTQIKIDTNLFSEHDKYAVLEGNKMMKNSVRFFTKPTIEDEFIYISDVDIIVTEPFKDCHIQDMKQYNSNYSNMLRVGTKKLTGLHFSKYNSYYPIPKLENINYLDNDEELLLLLVSQRNKIDSARNFRPVHGIHTSLSRPTILPQNGIPGWGVKNEQKESIHKIFTHSLFNDIYSLLSDEIKYRIKEIIKFFGFKDIVLND